jgi:hypothetical protein
MLMPEKSRSCTHAKQREKERESKDRSVRRHANSSSKNPVPFQSQETALCCRFLT